MSSSFSDFGSFIKNLEQIGNKMNGVNDECRAIITQGTAGGGMVQVEVNGLGEIINCKIEPSVFSQGDAELLEDMIVTATNEALAQAQQKQIEMMHNAAAETMNIPGINGIKDLFKS